MPLNPNGKIDKPALPFPDTAQLATAQNPIRFTADDATVLSATEKTLRAIWTNLLSNASSPIPLTESFFDLGGHSILATRLIFEIRKSFVINAPLGLVFDHPSIRELARAIDELRDADLCLTWKNTDGDGQPVSRDSLLATSRSDYATATKSIQIDYADDLNRLLPSLPTTFRPLPKDFASRPLSILLTGATGFLGAFILRDLLSRRSNVSKVTCLIRASSEETGLDRLRESACDRGVWDDAWINESRLSVVIGDLTESNFGLTDTVWHQMAQDIDVIVHNGAWVSLLVSFNCHSIHSIDTGSLGLSV